mmetsp:Transcript_39665/g.112496  ORF Transcript_39665/g.112496 Transcript_39665/m.112496 type:complete len:200 (+) Transcript_39665:782-1381(+)
MCRRLRRTLLRWRSRRNRGCGYSPPHLPHSLRLGSRRHSSRLQHRRLRLRGRWSIGRQCGGRPHPGPPPLGCLPHRPLPRMCSRSCQGSPRRKRPPRHPHQLRPGRLTLPPVQTPWLPLLLPSSAAPPRPSWPPRPPRAPQWSVSWPEAPPQLPFGFRFHRQCAGGGPPSPFALRWHCSSIPAAFSGLQHSGPSSSRAP